MRFLLAYARTTSAGLYPKITIKETRNGNTVALVRYAHEYDAGFAIVMLRKVRALYNGHEIIMPHSAMLKFADPPHPRVDFSSNDENSKYPTFKKYSIIGKYRNITMPNIAMPRTETTDSISEKEVMSTITDQYHLF